MYHRQVACWPASPTPISPFYLISIYWFLPFGFGLGVLAEEKEVFECIASFSLSLLSILFLKR
jgi:hypothetical protein